MMKGIAFIVALAVLFGVGAFIISSYFMEPVYQTRVKLYAAEPESTSSISGMYNIRSITPQYIEFLNVNEYYQMVADDLAENAGKNMTAKEISKAVSFSSVVSETSTFYMVVETNDPGLSYNIAQSVYRTAPERVAQFSNVGVLEPIDVPAVPVEPVSPSILRNTVIGLFLGFVLSAAVVVLKELLDNRIRTPEEITELFGLSVFGAVPEFSDQPQKGARK